MPPTSWRSTSAATSPCSMTSWAIWHSGRNSSAPTSIPTSPTSTSWAIWHSGRTSSVPTSIPTSPTSACTYVDPRLPPSRLAAHDRVEHELALLVHRLPALVVGADPLLDVDDAVDAVLDLGQIVRRAVVAEVVLDPLGVPTRRGVGRGDRRHVGDAVLLVGVAEVEVVVAPEQLVERGELLGAEPAGRVACGLDEVPAVVLHGAVAVDR